MEGIVANDAEDGPLTADVQIISNNLNVDVPGTYTLIYSVTDSDNNTTEATRTIKVTNVPTIIGADNISINPNSLFDPLEGITATDVEDGENLIVTVVSNTVDTSTPGDYEVVYSTVDSDGNTTIISRIVTVTNAPIITGTTDITINPGSDFNLIIGITADDSEDGDLTDKIEVTSNNLDVNIPGMYTIMYSVTDSDGNTTTFSRKITVTTHQQLKPQVILLLISGKFLTHYLE